MLLKAFRLFVSSTFNDFAREREVLQSRVFPALDAYCATKGYQCQTVDLRWGVNQEAQLDQRTAEICLGEVDAAKRYPPPNFLIMVADRYGWVPLPFAIAQDEFEAVTAWLAERGRAGDVHDLRKVYRLDENHLVPPGLAAAAGSDEPFGAYTLRSREDEDEIPDLAPPEDWKKLEDRLRGALQEAADHLVRKGLISETARTKYVLSLTEQEIIRGLPSFHSGTGNAARPASDAGGPPSIAWIREDAGGGADPERRPSLLRRILGSGSRPPAHAGSAVQRDPRVETLKFAIRRALPGDCVLSGRATRNGSGQLDAAYVEDFAARIESRLRAAFDQYIAGRSDDDELAQERAQHDAFAEERRRVFRGRDSNLAAIASYLAGDAPHPSVLYGPSGLGKSALMAQAVTEAQEPNRRVPVVYRFVGASAASADVRSLLISIVEDLADRGIVTKPERWEDDDYKFDEQVRTLLKSIDRPAAIFIDALDQLRKPSQTSEFHRLGWLPDQLPPALRIVVSVLDDDDYKDDSGVYRALRQRLPPGAFLEIEPLNETQGRDILLTRERNAQRRLRPDQRDYILGQFKLAGASPLYLRVAFEIARAWRSWDEAGQGRCVLAGETAALIGQFIAELTSAHHHEPELVSRTLGYLAAAKDGLSAKEMTEVLSDDAGVMQAVSRAAEKHGVPTPSVERNGVRTRKLPDSVWVRLHRQLAPLLVERRVDEQPLLQFFHRQLADIARERHYAPAKAGLHDALADYFDAGAGTTGKDAVASGRRTYGSRSLSELPYQLFHAGRRARLDEILMAPDWMQQKVAAAGVRALIDDYQYAHTKAQRLTGQTLELGAAVLARDARQLVPQILGRLRANLADDPADAVAIDSLLRDARALVSPPVLAPRWATFTAPRSSEVRRFERQDSNVCTVAFSPDARHIVSGSDNGELLLWDLASGALRTLERYGKRLRAVAWSPDGRHIVSGSFDGTLRLWDVVSGASRTLEGHGKWVKAVAWSPDGRQVVSGSDDSTLRLWDVPSGASRALGGHRGEVDSVAFAPDGQHVVSGSLDGTLRLWDVASGASRTLEGHGKWVKAVAWSPDGRQVVSGSSDGTLRLWDVVSEASRTLEGHHGQVNSVAFSPDGRQVVSGSNDHTLRLWDVASGASRALEGHGDDINAVAFSPDGRHVVSGSSDGTLRLWEVTNGASRTLEGHRREVMALAFSPDGRHLASGSVDRTLRLWDVASGASRSLKGGMVGAVAFSPDGRHMVSGSFDILSVFRSYHRTLNLWDVASGASRALEGHGDDINAVAFSPDGRHVVSGSRDRTLRLWEVANGQEIARLDGDLTFRKVHLAPDGKSLATVDRGGRVHLIDILLDEADKTAWLARQRG